MAAVCPAARERGWSDDFQRRWLDRALEARAAKGGASSSSSLETAL